MNHLVNITKKELKELLTPGTLASILVVVIMFAALGSMMTNETAEETSPKNIGIVYDGYMTDVIVDTPNITVGTLIDAAYCGTYDVDDSTPYVHLMNASSENPEQIAKELDENGYSTVIVIPKEFKQNIQDQKRTQFEAYYIYSNGGLFSTATSTAGASVISAMNSYLSYYLIQKSAGSSALFIESPIITPSSSSAGTNHTIVNGKLCDDVTPYEIYSATMSQNMIIPIIVMIVIVMIGSVVISSMGTEKENKTLETLLTMPIKRTTIVSGKLLAAAIVGLIYGVCYMAGMVFYSKGLTSGLGAGADLAKYGLSMDITDWIILLVILFLAIFSALAICMILGAFTKNYKMAQTMTLPISGLALVPMFVFMFTSWENLPGFLQAIMFLIPFSHPMMAMNNLMFDNFLLVFEGIAYLLILDAIMIFITVKIYNSDVLITGLGQSKLMTKLSKKKTQKDDNHGYE